MTRARNLPRVGSSTAAAIRPFRVPPAKVPVRTCAGCGVAGPRSALRRLALQSDGATVEWRERGGRGTYLHDADDCRRRFVSGKRRLPGLRASVTREAREVLVGRPPGEASIAGGRR